MKRKHRQPLFRMSRPSREEYCDRKVNLDHTDGAADQQDGESVAEIARIRLMKDARGHSWASRTANR